MRKNMTKRDNLNILNKYLIFGNLNSVFTAYFINKRGEKFCGFDREIVVKNKLYQCVENFEN